MNIFDEDENLLIMQYRAETEAIIQEDRLNRWRLVMLDAGVDALEAEFHIAEIEMEMAGL